ncbi:MAG TPA: TolC family protein [Byssovorax sp.]|jgi:outer membrane protein TolC
MGSLIIGGVAFAGDAFALQPLEQFVAAAQAQSTDVVEARATAEQHDAESKQAWLKLAPNFTAKGTYAHNQYDAEIPAIALGQPSTNPPIVIAPYDQFDAYFTVALPLVDVGSWLRIGGASATAEAGRLRAGASQLDIAKSTTQTYYQIVADAAAIDAAKRAQGASEDNLKVVRDRLSAGTASELDVERARAEVERAKQTVASAEVAYVKARRAMETATGIRPAEGAMPALGDGLAPETPLAALEPGTDSLPAVRAARLETKSAARTAQSAYAALAPTVTASATEHLTNATSFSAQAASYQILFTAQWTLDASVYYGAKASDAARAAAAARQRRTELAARDDLFNAWHQVDAQIATARAAQAQLDASTHAAKLVRDRYAVGSATQLEVTQADRDALQAEIAKIQAFSDLAYARALVKLDSGKVAPPALANEGAP